MRPVVDSDEALAQRALTDRDAFSELVSRYADRIFNLAYRMTGNRSEAEDMAQDAFLRAYRGLPSFRPGSPFAAWLYRIAVNVCLSQRRQERAATEPIDENEALIDPAAAVDDVAEQREVQETVQQAILSLPAMYRAVVILYHLEDRSYEDIATLLDLPVNTVRTHLYRGRAMLRERLAASREQ